MKTPEAIKKGLVMCSRSDGSGFCSDCPYEADGNGVACITTVTADGLAYIQQLEAKLAEVERERDAAVLAAVVMSSLKW